MSGLKAIQRRITSVRNTKQITRAMKLVSAAKLRRAQDAAVTGRAYRLKLDQVLRKVLKQIPETFSHPMLERRAEVKKRRVIVISGERGLCGAYNANVIKAVQANEGVAIEQGKVEFSPIGKQAASACKRFGWTTTPLMEDLGDDAINWQVSALSAGLLRDYAEGRIDEVVVYYTKFVSAMTQIVTREQILPFGGDLEAGSGETSEEGAEAASVTLFDPAPEEILVRLLPVLLGMSIRQAALESKASEHAARMTAMDSATRNADDLIGSLKLFYNRARQTAITRELIDIVGGTEAIK